GFMIFCTFPILRPSLDSTPAWKNPSIVFNSHNSSSSPLGRVLIKSASRVRFRANRTLTTSPAVQFSASVRHQTRSFARALLVGRDGSDQKDTGCRKVSQWLEKAVGYRFWPP